MSGWLEENFSGIVNLSHTGTVTIVPPSPPLTYASLMETLKDLDRQYQQSLALRAEMCIHGSPLAKRGVAAYMAGEKIRIVVCLGCEGWLPVAIADLDTIRRAREFPEEPAPEWYEMRARGRAKMRL